jgi:hypothetical protein
MVERQPSKDELGALDHAWLAAMSTDPGGVLKHIKEQQAEIEHLRGWRKWMRDQLNARPTVETEVVDPKIRLRITPRTNAEYEALRLFQRMMAHADIELVPPAEESESVVLPL